MVDWMRLADAVARRGVYAHGYTHGITAWVRDVEIHVSTLGGKCYVRIINIADDFCIAERGFGDEIDAARYFVRVVIS